MRYAPVEKSIQKMSESSTHGPCRVCASPAEFPGGTNYGRDIPIHCRRCGNFRLSGTVWETLPGRLGDDVINIAKVSYGIRRIQSRVEMPLVTTELVDRLLNDTNLPLPREQADNLIVWLGEQLRGRTGAKVKVPDETVVGVMGATSDEDANLLLIDSKETGLIRIGHGLGLTLEGWDRFYEIEREMVESRNAFMAMPFGKELLDQVYSECFRPAVKETGFDLRRIDESPSAGLIDHRLRVEIRRSRFLIAELTFGNHGAYWEAGFAEGLGRPVIYTCERSYFESKRTHFDTNHCHTILWDEDNLDKAVNELKATIRVTLPSEAMPPSDEVQ